MIALPRGGGAVRGMSETFAVNPANGTGTLTVPIATSAGRSGFGPELQLTYDSGAGNGPFGFGWRLELPSIARRTDRGLPRYDDAGDSDVYLLSGAEDLVPVPKDDGGLDHIDIDPDYRVRRYRPRIEGLFARIERWTSRADPHDVHWRSLSRDNVLTLYGRDGNSRVADDADDPTQIFSWLICESRDTKGNAVVYRYTPEDDRGVVTEAVHERNRDNAARQRARYLSAVKYGNRHPLLDAADRRPRFVETDEVDWCFEVTLDYGAHHPDRPTPKVEPDRTWPVRADSFSDHRAGFEVRTYRLCRRILLFHHFEGEADVGRDCLVRSTDLEYRETPVASFVTSITPHGFRRADGGYLRRSLPRLDLTYSEARLDATVRTADATNLPDGVDGTTARFADLDGGGIPGVLVEQAGTWLYKEPEGGGRFGALAPVGRRPAAVGLREGNQQLLDLAGDGSLDVVELAGPTPGFTERTPGGGWTERRTFRSLPVIDWAAPDLQFVDLDGDGRTDAVRPAHHRLRWHRALGEDGFGAERSVALPPDELDGPQLVAAGEHEQIQFADMCGDGLADVVRIRNGEVCYWPNLGHGRFAAKVTMAGAPRLDHPDRFSPRRVRLADVDGSGTHDLIHLGRAGVDVYFNQAGNGWSAPHRLAGFPPVDDLTTVSVTDLLGNGTACLVWSSPLPHHRERPLRYVDLMGGVKPHLLTAVVNNLGAETHLHYRSSTWFMLADKAAGRPWLTRLPFPVHVVERVETHDRISRNRFTTRYAYHHGCFDGPEREFRGFALVEQRDTEAFGALAPDGELPDAANLDAATHLPPVLTKTWFHTGAPPARGDLSERLAGLLDDSDRGEYYREPAWRDDDTQARERLLADTVLPDGLNAEETREAARALKGSMLRQEVYALDDDDPAAEDRPEDTDRVPYVVTEQRFAVRRLQARSGRRHAVFLTHPAETLTTHYERVATDPRVTHTLVLEVDDFGNVTQEATAAYGRRTDDASLPHDDDRERQGTPLITFTEREFTDDVHGEDDHHTPLPTEIRTYELTGYISAGHRLGPDELRNPKTGVPLFDKEIDYHEPPGAGRQRRLVEQVRTLYRSNDLESLGGLESRALPGESYTLAFTPELLAAVYTRKRNGQDEDLVPDPAAARDEGGYVDLNGDGRWWAPSGRELLSPRAADTPAEELTHARDHFFLPHRYRDPFGATSTVRYDRHDLLVLETTDPVGNRVTAGERPLAGDVTAALDYRVLQPSTVMDANRNRSRVVFDALGLVVGTAVLGKPEEVLGDSLAGFVPDLPEDEVRTRLTDPGADPHTVLVLAGTRLLYDVLAYQDTSDVPHPTPAAVLSLARERHGDRQSPVQHSIAYSDGFGRELQRKVLAEPGPVPTRDPQGRIVLDADGRPVLSDDDVPRWVGSGWTVVNNKGKPVRRFEPFFTDRPGFEFNVRVGVSPILFYDPIGRVVATLHPDHTYEKVVIGPWGQVAYDRNDTVAPTARAAGAPAHTGDPRTDPDIRRLVGGWFAMQPVGWRTWWQQRDGVAGVQGDAAARAAVHTDTPSTEHLDPLGRPFLTVTHNRRDAGGAVEEVPSRVELDVEGNRLGVRDALGGGAGRTVLRQVHDLRGRLVRSESIDAGRRWTLDDVAGHPIRSWDDRGHTFRMRYDRARRSLATHVTGVDPAQPDREVLTERTVYGEQHPDAPDRNLFGRVWLHLDQAGVAATEQHDFKGNPMRMERRLAREYRAAVDWAAVHAVVPAEPADPVDPAAPPDPVDAADLETALVAVVEVETFTTATTYDALDRVTSTTAPDATVIRPGYNAGNLLERLDADLPALGGGAAVPTAFVTDIDYDASGRRERVVYAAGAGVTAIHAYDWFTKRLTRLTTRRADADFPGDCPKPPPQGWPGCGLQDLHYTHDPVGNVTHIDDRAQQTIFFRNKRVEPSCDYTYDALYRLVEATGREHLGQAGDPIPHSPHDDGRMRAPHPDDVTAMGRYAETYAYDLVGNLLTMRHERTDAAAATWTRTFTYAEPSRLGDGRDGNRLSTTTDGAAAAQPYRYDAHGNLTRLPHLGGVDPDENMGWDHRDRLHRADLGGGGTAYYTYDHTGQRVRKVWEKKPGLVEERVYVGAFEVFRSRNGNGVVTLERTSVHVAEGGTRVATVETRVTGADPAPPRLTRFQLGNHLDSAVLELDAQAGIISYEEYSPYGSTTYQAVRSKTETPKRYRYTAKERVEETGLCYHGARYYAPWLARWTSPDPAGLVDGPNLYEYVQGNPVRLLDPTGTESAEDRVVSLGRWQQMGRWSALWPPSVPGNNPQLAQAFLAADAARATVLKPTLLTDLPNWSSTWRSLGNEPGLANGKFSGLASGVGVQQVFEGGTARAIHFDVTGVEVLGKGQTAGELRNVITTLQTGGNKHVDVHIAENGQVSTIPRGSTQVVGAPLPGRIAERLPNLSQPASAGGGGTTGPATPAPAASAPKPAGSGGPPAGSGGLPVITAGVGGAATTLARGLVPGVVEAEIALGGASIAAYKAGMVGVGGALQTGAAAVPVVGAGALVGTVGGHLGENVATRLGASPTAAKGWGALAALSTGAGIGALAGAPVGGVGAVPGAVIGGIAGLGGYLITRYW